MDPSKPRRDLFDYLDDMLAAFKAGDVLIIGEGQDEVLLLNADNPITKMSQAIPVMHAFTWILQQQISPEDYQKFSSEYEFAINEDGGIFQFAFRVPERVGFQYSKLDKSLSDFQQLFVDVDPTEGENLSMFDDEVPFVMLGPFNAEKRALILPVLQHLHHFRVDAKNPKPLDLSRVVTRESGTNFFIKRGDYASCFSSDQGFHPMQDLDEGSDQESDGKFDLDAWAPDGKMS